MLKRILAALRAALPRGQVTAVMPVILLAGACAPSRPRSHQLDHILAAAKPGIPVTEEECRVRKGNWSQQGLGGGPFVCDVAATDAGRNCTDSTQCEGICLAAKDIPAKNRTVGRCSASLREYGCFKFIENGSVRAICVD
jgi:hypothetical protein